MRGRGDDHAGLQGTAVGARAVAVIHVVRVAAHIAKAGGSENTGDPHGAQAVAGARDGATCGEDAFQGLDRPRDVTRAGDVGAAGTLLELVLFGLLALLFRNGGEVFGIALGDEVPHVG